jgi:hypothetical protein
MIWAWLLTALLVLAGQTAAGADIPGDDSARSEMLPAKTALRVHLTEALSSDHSRTGQHFSFVVLDPVAVDGRPLIARGAKGAGTVLLAGKAGTAGHEGDLTLRLDSVPTVGGHKLVFDDQRIRINGRNRKVMSGALGLIPWAGLGARFIRGSEIRIDPRTPITTVLDRAAVTEGPFAPVPVTAQPSATPT